MTSEKATEVMHEDAPRAIIGEIGNQIHNIACEMQGNEDLQERLAALASRTWEAAQLASQYPADVADAMVAVKPLEWEYVFDYGEICKAKTSVGYYSIHNDEDSCCGRVFCNYYITVSGDCTVYAIEVYEGYAELDEIQDFVWSFHEKRILSALQSPDDASAALAEAERKAWEAGLAEADVTAVAKAIYEAEVDHDMYSECCARWEDIPMDQWKWIARARAAIAALKKEPEA